MTLEQTLLDLCKTHGLTSISLNLIVTDDHTQFYSNVHDHNLCVGSAYTGIDTLSKALASAIERMNDLRAIAPVFELPALEVA